MDTSKYYVFYDGDCGFCNHWVQWILKNDKKDLFRFSELQSEFGQRFLKERGLENKSFNTLYLWKPNSFYLVKSEAVSKIAKLLGGKYVVLSGLNFLPKILSDKIYDQIAARRMKLASQNCLLPTNEEHKKFIE
ncbi:MAG: DCC1-like thiol-disulfide oxidoreductase family protein [Bergeyella sp.]